VATNDDRGCRASHGGHQALVIRRTLATAQDEELVMAAVVARTHDQSIVSLFAIITVVTLIVHDIAPIAFTVLYTGV